MGGTQRGSRDHFWEYQTTPKRIASKVSMDFRKVYHLQMRQGTFLWHSFETLHSNKFPIFRSLQGNPFGFIPLHVSHTPPLLVHFKL